MGSKKRKPVLLKWIRNIAYNQIFVRLIRSLGLRKWMRRIYYLLAKPRDNKMEVRFEGIDMEFSVDNPIEFRIVETAFSDSELGGERRVLQALSKNLEKGDVAYDIGANVGVHTVLMAKVVGDKGCVVAFEPESETFNTLKKNISINKLNNVIPLSVALSDRKDEKNLYFTGDTGGFSLRDKSGISKGSKVELIPGDILIKEKELPPPNVVKIDVEGFEYEVIKGLMEALKNKDCRMVVCEVHPYLLPQGVGGETIESLLESAGFNRIEKHFRGKNSHLFAFKENE